jgi:hypothetical protein
MRRVVGACSAVAALTLLLAWSTTGAGPARAASGCPLGADQYGFGVVRVDASLDPVTGCEYLIRIRCNGASHVEVEYGQVGGATATEETPDVTNSSNPTPCSSVFGIRINGSFHHDVIDASAVTAAGGFGNLGTQSSDVNVLDGGDGSDKLIGTAFKDRLVQGSDASPGTMRGGGGRDTLVGDDAHDRLFGGPGRDLLRGHDGRDRCVGGTGQDRATSCESRLGIP